MAFSAVAETIGTSGDDLSTKPTSFLVSNEHVTSGVPSSSSNETEESLSTIRTPAINGIEGSERHIEKDVANQVLEAIARRPPRRYMSDLTLSSGQNESKTAVVALNAFRPKDDMYHSQHALSSLSQISLKPSHMSGERPTSTLRNGFRHGVHSGAKSSTSFYHAPSPGQRRCRSTVDGMLTTMRPALTPSTASRPSSDSDLGRAFTNLKLCGSNSPLKSCIKQPATGGTSTPPNTLDIYTAKAESEAFPRIKTVDFKKDSPKNGLKPLISTFTSNCSNDAPMPDNNTFPGRINIRKSKTKSLLSFPNTICAIKSSVADPAITRTDVHATAAKAFWNVHDIINEEDADRDVPTIQTIETRSGSYEVVWDDVLLKQKTRTRGQRSSSTSRSKDTVSSSVRRDLERIGSKRPSWSGTWYGVSDSFKHTVVVFPHDDGQATSFECTIEGHKDFPLCVPPNSQVTRVTASRHTSRPASRSLTRAASDADIPL